jgi:DNA mismatch endonuclease, patch repair protein
MSSRVPEHPGSSSAAASAVGRGNQKQDTRGEVMIRSYLHRRGFRFRKNFYLRFPGRCGVRPDIVFASQRLAVFVDGCFWHSCPEHGTQPRTNSSYWEPKLRRNAERDGATDALLAANGWRSLRIWEHVPVEQAADMVAAALQGAA